MLRDTTKQCMDEKSSSNILSDQDSLNLCKRSSWLKVSKMSRSEDEGFNWWSESYLEKDRLRKHLFRSLHANYIDNYMVRRLVSGTSSLLSSEVIGSLRNMQSSNLTLLDQCGHGRDIIRTAHHANLERESHSSDALMSEMLREKCNLRGNKPLSCNDLRQAKIILEHFDVVLIMEWMSSSEQEASSWMIKRLQNVLGLKVSDSFDQDRLGAASSPSSGIGQLPWFTGGRGDVWRRNQAPVRILSRLEDDNGMDMWLYRWACDFMKEMYSVSVSASHN
jgi:hypothetical protein